MAVVKVAKRDVTAVRSLLEQSGPLGDFFGNRLIPELTEMAELLRLHLEIAFEMEY